MEHPILTKRIIAQLPHLEASFERVRAVSPQHRLAWNKLQRSVIFRDGWFLNSPVGARGDGETVQQHVDHLISLIEAYFPDDVKALAIAYAECHDDQETIAHAVIDGLPRDLNRFNTKSYSLSDQDKEAIEKMAIDILFEAEPEVKAVWMSYKYSKNEAAILFAGLDKVCVMWRCLAFIQSGKYSYEDFQDYWDYWTPETAKAKLPSLIAEIYIEHVWDKAQILRQAANLCVRAA